MTEPHMRAWADQFGALLRDKCRQMIRAIAITGWESCAHAFKDDEGEPWRLVYHEGHFLVLDLSDEDPIPIILDLIALGVPEE